MKKLILSAAIALLAVSANAQTVKSGNRVVKLNAESLAFIRSCKCPIINQFLEQHSSFTLVNNDLADMMLKLYDRRPRKISAILLLAKGKI
jgi:hypothetical protein